MAAAGTRAAACPAGCTRRGCAAGWGSRARASGWAAAAPRGAGGRAGSCTGCPAPADRATRGGGGTAGCAAGEAPAPCEPSADTAGSDKAPGTADASATAPGSAARLPPQPASATSGLAYDAASMGALKNHNFHILNRSFFGLILFLAFGGSGSEG